MTAGHPFLPLTTRARSKLRRSCLSKLASLLLLLSFPVTASPAARDADASFPLQYASPETVKSWVDANSTPPVVLDVRALDEFAAGHLPEARHIEYDHVTTLAPELSHDRPIVLYCIHSTFRAPTAARALLAAGFRQVYILDGGIVAWQVAGFPIVSSDIANTPTILPLTKRCQAKERL